MHWHRGADAADVGKRSSGWPGALPRGKRGALRMQWAARSGATEQHCGHAVMATIPSRMPSISLRIRRHVAVAARSTTAIAMRAGADWDPICDWSNEPADSAAPCRKVSSQPTTGGPKFPRLIVGGQLPHLRPNVEVPPRKGGGTGGDRCGLGGHSRGRGATSPSLDHFPQGKPCWTVT